MQHYFQIEMPEDASQNDCDMEMSRFKAFMTKRGFTFFVEAQQFTIETTRFGGVYQVLVSVPPDVSRAFREAGDHYAREHDYEVPFIRVYDQYMPPLLLDGQVRFIAKQCHEANRAYHAALGDDSQPAWGDSTEDQRAAAISAVREYFSDTPAPADYAVVPPDQRVKDYIFRAIVNTYK